MAKLIGVKLTDMDLAKFELAATAAGFKTVAAWLRELGKRCCAGKSGRAKKEQA